MPERIAQKSEGSEYAGFCAKQEIWRGRPHSDTAQLIQLDDLKADSLDRLRDVAFLTLQTSPGNHQAWIAVSGLAVGEETKEFARRLRKGAGADPSASVATRVAGTVNYKRRDEPDLPTVRIADATPGRIVTPEQLEALGLLAPTELVQAPTVLPLRTS
jgi:DNA primase RepB-like protein